MKSLRAKTCVLEVNIFFWDIEGSKVNGGYLTSHWDTIKILINYCVKCQNLQMIKL